MAKTTEVIDTDKTRGDLVAQLLAQHEQVRAAINDVAATTTAESRQEAFDRLRELLARHETAEEMVVRPLTRGIEEGGESVAAARMDEENESKDASRQVSLFVVLTLTACHEFSSTASSQCS